MKKLLFIVSMSLVAIVAGCTLSTGKSVSENQTQLAEKIYVAIEEEGKIAVIDSEKRQVITSIDLSEEHSGMAMKYMAHNVQVAPDGKTVWVTANAMDEGHGGEESSAEEHGTEIADQVIVIDPYTDRITKRITIEPESHLAHVVLTPDNKSTYVTLQEKGAVYAINTETYALENKIDLGTGSGPHGLRVSPDGSKVFIALLSGKALAVLNTADGSVEQFSTGSEAVQTAVTPDGRYIFVSLYGTKQVARFDVASGTMSTISLPSEAKGPVQLYATPDSQYLYVADQGYYFDQPTSMYVYRIDIGKSVVDQTIPAGSAPHGVVVDRNGKFVYVTNLLSNDISVIDTAAQREVARIPVGKMPNGISIWNNPTP